MAGNPPAAAGRTCGCLAGLGRCTARHRAGKHAGQPQIAPLLPAGISLKTQELYALVFVTRYLDLFYSFISV